jgi:N-succinyldiaminopimelate aminotransferase
MTGAWRAHQISSFAIHHPAQFGVAHGLQLDDRYFAELIAFYDQKRQRLTRGLDAIGMPYFMPEGAFYVMADFSRFHVGNSEAFAKYLIQEVGVATIPPTSFYSEAHQDVARQYVRFAFCKTDEVLDAAVERLQKLRPLV